MKPVLFAADATTFTSNGLGRLTDAISCTVTEERNGPYELHMEYPIDGRLIEEIQYSRIILAKPADEKDPQPFRIYRITKPLSGVVEIDAEHISYQMTHIPIMPYTAASLGQALAGFQTYAAEANPFSFTIEGTFGSVVGSTFNVSQPDSLRSLLFGQDGSIIDTYGGEWEFDGYDAILHKDRGADSGVTIRYGKNLTDLKQDENIETTYTGICPFWKGPGDGDTEVVVTLSEKVVHSSAGSSYPYQRTKVVDMSSNFLSQPTAAQLRSAAESYIETNAIGSPVVSLDVSFVALHQTQEYAELTHIEHINLCDTVKVIFPMLDVNTKAKVVKTVWNVLLDRYDSITIGAVKSRLSSSIQAYQQSAIEQAVSQAGESASGEYATIASVRSINAALGLLQERMLTAETSLSALDGMNGGYIYITIDANHQTDELLVLVDSPVLSAAQKIFRLNELGLTYTTGGYAHGTWTTIIDAQGRVSAAALSGLSQAIGGLSVPLCYIPTTITGGSPSSYTPARIVDGVIRAPIYHTVTYLDEDGETELSVEQVIDGTDCVDVPTPTKTGYVFSGWTDEVGGSVDSSLTEGVTEDRSLIAVYEEEE